MTSPRLLILVCSLAGVLVLALALLFLRGEARTRLADSASNEAADRSRAAALEANRRLDREVPAGARSRAEPVLHAPRVPAFAEASGLRLVLLDARTRRPVPGAEVHAWEDVTGRYGVTRDYDQWMGPDLATFIALRSPALASDEEGIVDLPVAGRMRYVTARAGELFGFAGIEPEERGLAEMLLEPSHALIVLVRDASGKPQPGVRVGLGECTDAASFWDQVTDDQGRCRIPDVETLVREAQIDPGTPVAVRLALPFKPPVEEWIDLERLPPGPVELVMPPTGSLRIKLVDEAGHVVPLSGTLHVFATDSDLPAQMHPVDEMSSGRFPIEAGLSWARHVGLGQVLTVEADLPGTGDPFVDVAGPKEPGEVIDVEISLEADHTLLRGRIVDESGQPLANVQFDWRRTIDDAQHITASGRDLFTTGADGRFQWTLRRMAGDTAPAVHRAGWLCEVSTAPLRRQAAVTFPLEIVSGATDLGDIVMVPRGPLVTGRVVDPEGRGVPDVDIELNVAVSRLPDRPRAGAFDAQLDTIDEAPIHDSTRTAEDGSFAIYGPCLDLRFVLRATGPGLYPPQLVPFSCGAGQGPITIRASLAGSLVGTALVDRDWNGEDLDVRFIAEGAKPDEWHSASIGRAGDRVCFRLGPVAPCRGQVAFHSPGDAPAALLAVAAIEVVAGSETRPPRLVDVDLRGKLPKSDARAAHAASFELEIVDARGQPIPRGVAWIWTEEEGSSRHLWTAGRARIRQPAPQMIEVWAPGFRERVLRAPVRSGRVALDPELDVELVFTALPRALLGNGIVLHGSLGFEQQTEDQFVPSALERQCTFVLGPESKARVRLPAAGTFWVGLSVSRLGVPGTDDIDGYPLAVPQTPLVVRDTDGLQVLTCELDAEEMKRALVDLGLSKD